MRWKWKIGLLAIAAIEGPIIAWAGVVLQVPADGLLYLAGVLTAMFLFLLVVRPILFGILGLWLAGIGGGSWYFLRYVPASFAVAFATVLSTLGCAVGSRVYLRGIKYLLRRGV